MTKQNYYLIGIGGIGMSALARILVAKGHEVSGSDRSLSANSRNLQELGIQVFEGHEAKNVPAEARVLYSTAISEDNPEWQAAKEGNCELLHRSEFLQELQKEKRSITVTGTHGKTGTSALLAHVFRHLGHDPSFAIGGLLREGLSNGHWGEGDFFVVEGDESDASHLRCDPWGAIVTNLEGDHLNHYGSFGALESSFEDFFAKLEKAEGPVFWCGDDLRLRKMAKVGQSYGFGAHCDWRLDNVRQDAWVCTFDAVYGQERFSDISVPLVGAHNALNTLAVFALCLTLGVSKDDLKEALASFKGTSRRCEGIGRHRGALFLDDYAHHPTEIACTLKGIRGAIEERHLISIFQPHRFSRTRDCQGSFGAVFDAADEVWITDVYAAGEEAIKGVDHQLILQELRDHGKKNCRYVPRDRLEQVMAEAARPFDVFVTMGAGDITHAGREAMKLLEAQPCSPLKVGLIFGGRSPEHGVSLTSAKNVLEGLECEYFEVLKFGITKGGQWIEGGDSLEILEAWNGTGEGTEGPSHIPQEVLAKLNSCEVVFPLLHGPLGEDGMIQGFLETLGIPYVGCGYSSSALCMDKVATKSLLSSQGLPVVPALVFTREDWKEAPHRILERIQESFPAPWFIKPASQGSSHGVSRKEGPDGVLIAVSQALAYEDRVLVEPEIKGRELEFAVVGNQAMLVPPPGEIIKNGRWYGYEEKYSEGLVELKSQADLSDEEIQTMVQVVERAYRACSCQGFARVDTFLSDEGGFFINELTTIPGFTNLSLFPQIWGDQGVGLNQLLVKLIVLALEKGDPARRGIRQLWSSTTPSP